METSASYQLRSRVASPGRLMLTVLNSSAQQQLVFRASTQRYVDDVKHANVTGTASYRSVQIVSDGHVTAYQVINVGGSSAQRVCNSTSSAWIQRNNLRCGCWNMPLSLLTACPA
jgi:hypothetical protein